MEDALKAILHETPASVSLADPDGYTALHWAVRFRQEGCIRLLLAAKADVNARTSPDQETPLHIGSWYDWEHGIRLLLAAGAEVNARSSVGLSPLDIAAIGDNTSVMKLLITAGAQVDDRNDLGETALHQAAGSGALNAVELLLDSGAFVNARSKAGRTPLKEASDPQGSFQEVAYRMGEQEMYWVPIEKGPEDLPALLRFLHARDEGETTLAEVVALLRKCGGSE